MTDLIPEAISKAIAALWRRRGPRPDNSFETPEFLGLKEACATSYSVGAGLWFTTSLWHILKSLGCPMLLPTDKQALSLTAEQAAKGLHIALTATTARIIHLCPLDWADDPPPVDFGSSRLSRFSSSELMTILDAPRLTRTFPNAQPDWERLSEFYWLVVEETLPIAGEPGARTSPFMYEINRDYGAITAHEDRFPPAVEQALFLLLLAPWEDWSQAQEVDWRGFRIPWVYSVNDDLCVPLKPLPLDSSLTWLPYTYFDAYGESAEEVEIPARFSLADEASELPIYVNDGTWADIACAFKSPLFETPIRHFLVRAYHSTGIDEFIAHLTVLEAALGLQSDYGGKPASDPRKGRRVTQIMMGRVAALLDDLAAGTEFEALFNLRSAYVHGRPMAPISSADRFRARRLARRVVAALIGQALGRAGRSPVDREVFLVDLVQRS